jgi:membrane-associated protein
VRGRDIWIIIGGYPIIALGHLLALLATYTYATLFPLSVVEGPMVTVLAGYLAYLGHANPVLIYLVVVAGDLTGDFIWYAVGRWGRRALDWKWASYLGITPQRLARIDAHFARHSGKTLLLGKLTQGLGALVLVGAGASRVRASRFLLFNLLATLPKSLALLLFGYFFGKAYTQAGSVLDYAALATVLVALLAAMTYFVPRRFAARLQ